MFSKIKDAIGNIFHIDEQEKAAEAQKTANLQQKTNRVFGTDRESVKEAAIASVNPFLKKNGELTNPNLNYQKILDNPGTSKMAKMFISNATGLSPTQSAETNTLAFGPSSSTGGKLGFISAKYETGGYDGGKVSSGAGDYGGISYGIPQFSTTTGSADKFVNWLKQSNPEMGKYFGNSRAGSTEFSNAWKQVYSKYGDAFSNVQTSYAYDNFVQPLANLAKQKTGIDYTRSDALKELLFSTAIQFGSGSLGLSALGNVSANMSDADIINASYDKKIANYKSFFKDSSSDVQESVRNRFANERNDVLALVGNKLSNSYSGNNGIAKAAQKYIGTPYVWGGESMNEGGMDCSGFVYNALKDAGYNIGRTTAQGYRNYGKSVSKSNMQPGDLIFFGKNNNDASHIGIYIGNGQMIHSAGGSKNTKSNPGKGVTIASVNYRNDFLEARRY